MAKEPPQITRAQRRVCERYEVPRVPVAPGDFVAIARNVGHGVLPINGMRYQPEADTTGWFIWAGGDKDWSDDPDFFGPMHAGHLPQLCPQIVAYLGLPPGYRFQIAPGYEEVWEDRALLDAEPGEA